MATHNEKEIMTRWPVTSGLVAKTTSQTGREMRLIPLKSNVKARDKIGL